MESKLIHRLEKNRTTVICFKFKVDGKPVLVMPLQGEGYPEASSN